MFKIDIDVSKLQEAFSPERLEQAGALAAEKLTELTHAKILELGSQRLTYRMTLLKEHTHVDEESPGVYLIWLEDNYAWVNDGIGKFDMLPGLLKGQNHKVIPFSHGPGQGPATTPAWKMDLVNTVKAEMKKQKIPWAKVERDDQGRPKLGQLHKLKVVTPNKTKIGPGMGHGNVGEARSGFVDKPHGKPFLDDVAVYQHEVGGKVQRQVLTFRTASIKQMGTGMWEHPGFNASRIFEDAYEWALNALEKEVMPEIVRKMQEEIKS